MDLESKKAKREARMQAKEEMIRGQQASQAEQADAVVEGQTPVETAELPEKKEDKKENKK